MQVRVASGSSIKPSLPSMYSLSTNAFIPVRKEFFGLSSCLQYLMPCCVSREHPSPSELLFPGKLRTNPQLHTILQHSSFMHMKSPTGIMHKIFCEEAGCEFIAGR